MRIPGHLLEEIDEFVERTQTTRDELYAVAIKEYLRVEERRDSASPRSAKRKAWDSAKMARVAIELTEEHYTRAGKVAKRFDKPREMFIAEAVAEYVHRHDPKPEAEDGHDVPRGTGSRQV